jgi:hypothetical protein
VILFAKHVQCFGIRWYACIFTWFEIYVPPFFTIPFLLDWWGLLFLIQLILVIWLLTHSSWAYKFFRSIYNFTRLNIYGAHCDLFTYRKFYVLLINLRRSFITSLSHY